MNFFKKRDKHIEDPVVEYTHKAYDEDTLSRKIGMPYGELLSAAYAYVGKYMDSYFDGERFTEPTFAWLQTSLFYPSFQHMAFRYHNNVYSILIAFVKNGEIMTLERDFYNQMSESKANNMIPCLCPVLVDTFVPVFPGCHLVRSDGQGIVQLSEGEERTPMSAWELSNFAVSVVLNDIVKNGGQITRYSDMPSIEPNIWFSDKEGKQSYVIVKAVTGNTKENASYKPSSQLIDRLKAFNGYFGEVFIESAEPVAYDAEGHIVKLSRRDDKKNPIVILSRGCGMYVAYNGLTSINEIARDRGVKDASVYDI